MLAMLVEFSTYIICRCSAPTLLNCKLVGVTVSLEYNNRDCGDFTIASFSIISCPF